MKRQQKPRPYRTKDDLKAEIKLALQQLGSASRLEISRFLGLAKSPRLIECLNELVMSYEFAQVRRWYLNRTRYEYVYFAIPPIDHATIMQSTEDKAIAARGIYAEFYIEANGGLLGRWDYKETYRACICGYDATIRIRYHGECWDECMTCGMQAKAEWNE